MKKLLSIALLTSTSVFADVGIMLDIEVIIHGPTGKGGVEIAICK